LPNQSSDSREIDIEFRAVTKRFDDVVAVDDVSLTVERGAFFSFLGPSGCGKTTSLRLIAGFDQPSDGDVFIGGTSVVGIPPHKRPVNMVFQQYALFPHMNVAENIGYGLRQRNPKPDRPTCLLLDEPLAALDRKLRREMQIELQTLQREVGITFILVTHDQEEALSMSDRICIMREGQIVQSGSPRELYDEPVNRDVADFVGKTNFFSGAVVDVNNSSVTVKSESGQVLVGTQPTGAATLTKGSKACVAVRPEMISIMAADETNDSNSITIHGQVMNRIFLGEHSEYLIATEGYGKVMVLSPKSIESINRSFVPGDNVSISWRPEAVLILGDT